MIIIIIDEMMMNRLLAWGINSFDIMGGKMNKILREATKYLCLVVKLLN